MPRVQVQEPLLNAPALRTTIRPIDVPGAATPPPRIQDNGIMQLADALQEWQPVLRQMVVEKAAQDKEAALTYGDVEAAKLSAEERMMVINGTIKKTVDNGTLPRSFLPFAQMNFDKRIGADAALIDYSARLAEAYKTTTTVDGRVDPEQLIAQTRKEFLDKMPTGSYAVEGFLSTAAQVEQKFRQNSNEEYRKNYEAAMDARLDDEGVRTFEAVVDAADDEQPGVKANLLTFIQKVGETEIPLSEKGPRLATWAGVAVARLVGQGHYDKAREAIQLVRETDLTGQGGLAGNIAGVKAKLNKMEDDIARAERVQGDPYKVKAEKNHFFGQNEAGRTLTEVEASGVPLTDQLVAEKVKTFAANNPNNPDALGSYKETLEARQRKGVLTGDPKLTNELARKALSPNLKVLAETEEMLEVAYTAGSVTPADYNRIQESLDKARAGTAFITEDVLVRDERAIFLTESGLDETSQPAVMPAFASGSLYRSELNGEQRRKVRQDSMAFYQETLLGLIQNSDLDNPAAIKAALPQLRAAAVNAASQRANDLTLSYLPKDAEGNPMTQQQITDLKAAEAKAAKEPKAKPVDPLQGVVTQETSRPNRGAIAPEVRTLVTEWKNDQNRWNFRLKQSARGRVREASPEEKAVIIYKSATGDYAKLMSYRSTAKDKGDAGYITLLREFATQLKTYGGAEYLTPEQLTQIGINPAAFPNAGTRLPQK